MTEFNEYAAGTFCWVDLATSEAAGAKKFYGELFGWKLADTPAGPDMVYTMAQMRDKPVAALYEMSQEMKSQGIPPHWLSYVSVSDVDESAAKAKALGGQVLMAPADVMEAGRMALIQDPTGATVALWQPKAHIGAQIVNEPGALCWNELATRDTKTAEDFLTQLFGWTTDKQDMGPMIYTSFKVGERYNGGMLQMTEEWGNLPPHWMVYFAVEDCEASVEQAKALGARIGVPPTDIPAVGRFAVIEDPQGAVFTIIKMENPE